jgi:hypothetical protein
MIFSEDLHAVCPGCTRPLPPVDLTNGPRTKCPACQADLAIGYKYQWLCSLLSLVGGVTAASIQGLPDCSLVLSASIYSITLFVFSIFFLLPHFPKKVSRRHDYFLNLRIP